MPKRAREETSSPRVVKCGCKPCLCDRNDDVAWVLNEPTSPQEQLSVSLRTHDIIDGIVQPRAEDSLCGAVAIDSASGAVREVVGSSSTRRTASAHGAGTFCPCRWRITNHNNGRSTFPSNDQPAAMAATVLLDRSIVATVGAMARAGVADDVVDIIYVPTFTRTFNGGGNDHEEIEILSEAQTNMRVYHLFYG